MINAILCSNRSFLCVRPCIEGLITQSVQFNQIHVVFQCVNDIDWDWVNNYPILKVYNIQQQGLSVARNFAHQFLESGYVVYVDDDASYPRDFVKEISSHPMFGCVDLIYTNYIDKVTGRKFRKPIGTRNVKKYLRNFPSSICIVVHTSAPTFSLGFDEKLGLGKNTEIKSDEDTDFLLRVVDASATFADAPQIFCFHSLEDRNSREDYMMRVRAQGAAAVIISMRYFGFFNLFGEVLENFARLIKSIVFLRIDYLKFYTMRVIGQTAGVSFIIASFYKSILACTVHRVSIYLRKLAVKNYYNVVPGNLSIISNNCTGGHIEKDFFGEYSSPFVNMIIPPICFVKLANNFNCYIKKTPILNYYSNLFDCHTCYPVVYLGDVEIHYIHYGVKDPVLEIFQRRLSRIKTRRLFVAVERDGFNKNHFEKIDVFSDQKFFVSKLNLMAREKIVPFVFGVPSADISIGYLYYFSTLLSKIFRF